MERELKNSIEYINGWLERNPGQHSPWVTATKTVLNAYAALTTERDRLREALEAVIDQADAQFSVRDKYATFNKRTIDSARAALQPTEATNG